MPPGAVGAVGLVGAVGNVGSPGGGGSWDTEAAVRGEGVGESPVALDAEGRWQ